MREKDQDDTYYGYGNKSQKRFHHLLPFGLVATALGDPHGSHGHRPSQTRHKRGEDHPRSLHCFHAEELPVSVVGRIIRQKKYGHGGRHPAEESAIDCLKRLAVEKAEDVAV